MALLIKYALLITWSFLHVFLHFNGLYSYDHRDFKGLSMKIPRGWICQNPIHIHNPKLGRCLKSFKVEFALLLHLPSWKSKWAWFQKRGCLFWGMFGCESVTSLGFSTGKGSRSQVPTSAGEISAQTSPAPVQDAGTKFVLNMKMQIKTCETRSTPVLYTLNSILLGMSSKGFPC